MKFKSLLFITLLTGTLLISSCAKGDGTKPNSESISDSSIHEHNWGEPTYVWADDYSNCTATRVCLDNAEHKETETKQSVYTVLVESTCLTEGQGKYTVIFDNKAFSEQTYEVTLNPKGHAWEDPTYEWNTDYSQCTATRVCANDASHIETETVNSTYELVQKPTCCEVGIGRFTAAFTKKCFETQTHDISIDIDVDGHNYIISVVEATADEEGYTLHTCEHCHNSFKTDITSAENNFTYADYMDGYEITGYTGEAEIINVPATHNDLQVKRITSLKTGRIIQIPDSITVFVIDCFRENTQLEEINIPEGTTNFPSFFNCTSLKTIVVPDSVTGIDQYTFSSCNALEEITLPFIGKKADDPTYHYLNCIFGGYTYEGNLNYVPHSLKKVILSSACTKIPDYAFYKCEYLEEVVIGENVTTIGYSAFGQTKKIKEINIPKNVSEIQEWAFAALNGADYIEAFNVDEENENYTSVDGVLYSKNKNTLLRFPSAKPTEDGSFMIPDYVKEIGPNAFRYNSSLINIDMNDNVETFNRESFYCVSNLKTIHISNSIKALPNSCFKGCKQLTSPVLPDGLESIDNYAFDECSSLKTITIPASVTSIGTSVFGASYITTIIFLGNIRNIQFDPNWNQYLNRISVIVGNEEEPYGLMINGDTYLGAPYFGFGDGGNRRYLQFLGEGELNVGDKFVFYDNVSKESFDITMDPYSLGGTSSTSEDWKNYFDFDGITYTVKVARYYQFFIKIDGVNNNVYFS